MPALIPCDLSRLPLAYIVYDGIGVRRRVTCSVHDLERVIISDAVAPDSSFENESLRINSTFALMCQSDGELRADFVGLFSETSIDVPNRRRVDQSTNGRQNRYAGVA